MHPDWLVELFHGGEERTEFGRIERLAFDIGKDLRAAGAKLVDGARCLRDAGVGRGQRGLRDKARKLVRIFRAQFGHAVVADPGKLERELGIAPGDLLECRRGQRDHLLVVLEPADDLAAMIEVVQRGQLGGALADVRQSASQQFFEIGFREEVVEGVDTHAE